MKKIIATVLAMVMALALCSTAFAADPEYTKAYNKKGNEITAGATYTVKSDAATYNKTTGEGSVAAKKVTWDGGTTYKYYVESTKADYDLKLTASGRSDLYLSKVADSGKYMCKAVAFKAIGDKCGQLDADTTDTYYTNSGKYMGKDDARYFVADSDGLKNVLVDGKLVAVSATIYDDDDLNQHEWEAASYNKDNTVATYKCTECGTVATVYKTKDAAVAAGMNTVEVLSNGDIIGYNFTAAGASGSTSGAKPSPKTFDAGIAMYVGMALTSVAGSAVVIGKKKEF